MRIGIEPGSTKTELIALAGVINILDPDAIVPGGGLSNMDIVYGAVPAQWR